MSQPDRRCYGRMYGKLDKCATCTEAVWCRDAGDPPPIGVCDDVPDAEDRLVAESRAGSERSETAALFLQACVLIIEACDGNCQRIGIALARAAGLTYAEIGARLHVTKQAIAKHIAAIGRRNAAFGGYLAGHAIPVGSMQGFPADVTNLERSAYAQFKRVSSWLRPRG